MKEEEIKEEEESFAFKVLQYKIYATSRQYIVYDSGTEKKDKRSGKMTRGGLHGYFASLSGALGSIRDDEMRNATIGTGTLDKAIEKIAKMNADYEKIVEPLKKIELYTH